MNKLLKNKRGQTEMMFSNIILLVIFLAVVSFGGILAGLIYFDMNILSTNLHTINFPLPIEDNASIGEHNVTDFQGILDITIYPLLGLKDSLPMLTYFMVFAFIIALGMVAYLSSKNPIFFVVHVLFTLLITYFAIILSNVYKTLISNPFMNSMMVPFTIYNRLMFSLPIVIFFTSLLFAGIAFINLIKPQSPGSSTGGGIQYGGDY